MRQAVAHEQPSPVRRYRPQDASAPSLRNLEPRTEYRRAERNDTACRFRRSCTRSIPGTSPFRSSSAATSGPVTRFARSSSRCTAAIRSGGSSPGAPRQGLPVAGSYLSGGRIGHSCCSLISFAQGLGEVRAALGVEQGVYRSAALRGGRGPARLPCHPHTTRCWWHKEALRLLVPCVRQPHMADKWLKLLVQVQQYSHGQRADMLPLQPDGGVVRLPRLRYAGVASSSPPYERGRVGWRSRSVTAWTGWRDLDGQAGDPAPEKGARAIRPVPRDRPALRPPRLRSAPRPSLPRSPGRVGRLLPRRRSSCTPLPPHRPTTVDCSRPPACRRPSPTTCRSQTMDGLCESGGAGQLRRRADSSSRSTSSAAMALMVSSPLRPHGCGSWSTTQTVPSTTPVLSISGAPR